MKKLFFFLLTVVCALLYAPPASAWVVYLDPANTDGFTPTAYVWDSYNGNQKLNGDFPGNSMSKDKYGRWKASGTGTPTNVIFTYDGSNKCFSGDPTYSDNYTYTWDGTKETETITKSKWKEYTVYFDKTGHSSWTPYIYTWGKTAPTGFTQMTLVSGNIYSVSLASGETTPTLIFNNGESFDNDKSNQTVDVSITDGYIYKTTSQVSGGDDNGKWNTSGSEYNPVNVTSVELLKKGAGSIGTKNAAPYAFSLSGLTGNEEFLIRVNYDNSTSKTYTVSSGTSLTEGAGYFKLDSKIINTVMTVNVSGTAATSYSLSGTVNDAITGVYLGNDKMNGSGSKYTLNGVTNNTTGYTVKVTTTRNTAGTTYTVNSGNNLLAGNHTLTPGTANFTVASTLATFNAEVAMNTTTFVPSSITIGGDTPDTPGTKKHVVYFRNRDYNCGGQNGWSDSFSLTAWDLPYFYITENGSPLATRTAMVKVEGENNVWKAEWTQSDDNAKAKLLFYNGTFVNSDANIYGTQTVDIEAKEGNYIYEIKLLLSDKTF